MATLLLSQGTPMILAGDEIGRTQQGNNNTYCQDNELNWVDWTGIDAEGQGLAAFARKLIALRQGFADASGVPGAQAVGGGTGQVPQPMELHETVVDVRGLLLQDRVRAAGDPGVEQEQLVLQPVVVTTTAAVGWLSTRGSAGQLLV